MRCVRAAGGAMRTAVLVVGLTGAAAASAAQTADEAQHIARARELLKLFLNGKDQEFVQSSEDAMLKLFKPEQSAQVRQQFTAQFGALQSPDGPIVLPATASAASKPSDAIAATGEARIAAAVAAAKAEYKHSGAFHSVTLKLPYDKATITLQITMNDEGKLSGFHIPAVEANKPWEPPAYVDQSKFTEEKVTVKTGTIELPGTLTLPKAAENAEPGAKRAPGIVLVHGSGPNDEDETILGNKPFRDLAWGLATNGVAVLRYEKRTHKYGGQLNPNEITLEQETIDDALSALQILRGRPEIDSQDVFVLGHSLGGMAAPFIAGRDSKLAGAILLAGSARPVMDVLEDQIRYGATLAGELSDADKKETDRILRMIADIRAGTAEPTQVLLGAPVHYWKMLNEYDPVSEAKKLKLPILVIQGGRDYQVTMKCFARWKDGLAGRENVTFKLFERMNHLMVAGDAPSTPADYMQAGHVDQSVIQEIAEWLARVIHARRQ